MIPKKLRDEITSLVRREVVPAVGCTEPVAVALCVARATEELGCLPAAIEVSLSANVLKNAMGVGIPGTGMIGLPIAIALGAIVGRSEKGLEVLEDVTPEAVSAGRRYIEEGRIRIGLAENPPSVLHIEVRVSNEAGEFAEAVISRTHTGFVVVKRGDEVVFESDMCEGTPGEGAAVSADCELDMATVVEYALETPLEEIDFILDARKLNMAAAECALNGDYGHSLGSSIRNGLGLKLFGDSPLEHIISYTSAACDARMGGARIAVMSNSGSGNQGICATMPVVSYAIDCGASEEETIRALMMSHLTSIYIKQSLGRLSALCGCVVASTGASAGLTYLLGGGYREICSAVKNMIANLTGMICDGAKPSCSLKISSGVSTALMSAMLAINGKCVTEAEGIISDDVDRSIHNLTSIGREAMRETDRLVLEIMTGK
ncbi:MAG: L-serine ammonia-lyase, iron-sulfur-dependent, subunit alpha [Muribaculaceae bacterium]|nr:L-serine ammonia-lyase, iron-sulfur-dependent, subunit alpha [Muribaculaceae bacterium]